MTLTELQLIERRAHASGNTESYKMAAALVDVLESLQLDSTDDIFFEYLNQNDSHEAE